MPQTHSQYTLPAIGPKLAYQAKRNGVAARLTDPAVQKSLAVDLALISGYEEWLRDLELAIVSAAKHHDAHTFYRLRPVPGIGKSLRRVLLYDIQAMERFPRGHELASYGRLGKGAKASAGTRSGTSGANIGNAPLTGAFSKAAIFFLRENPAAQKFLARWANKHRKGKA